MVAELLLSMRLIREPIDIDELVDHRVRLLPQPMSERDVAADPANERGLVPVCIKSMVRWLFLRRSARGGEVRTLWDSPHVRCVWHEVPSEWFRWQVVASVPWRDARSHINVCEARARCLAIKIRARHRICHRCRYFHLLDSQVNLAQSTKGRTSSLRMAHVLRQSSTFLLCCGLRDVNGFTRSEKNPADRASRDLRRWRAYGKARALRERAATHGSRRSRAPREP